MKSYQEQGFTYIIINNIIEISHHGNKVGMKPLVDKNNLAREVHNLYTGYVLFKREIL